MADDGVPAGGVTCGIFVFSGLTVTSGNSVFAGTSVAAGFFVISTSGISVTCADGFWVIFGFFVTFGFFFAFTVIFVTNSFFKTFSAFLLLWYLTVTFILHFPLDNAVITPFLFTTATFLSVLLKDFDFIKLPFTLIVFFFPSVTVSFPGTDGFPDAPAGTGLFPAVAVTREMADTTAIIFLFSFISNPPYILNLYTLTI